MPVADFQAWDPPERLQQCFSDSGMEHIDYYRSPARPAGAGTAPCLAGALAATRLAEGLLGPHRYLLAERGSVNPVLVAGLARQWGFRRWVTLSLPFSLVVSVTYRSKPLPDLQRLAEALR